MQESETVVDVEPVHDELTSLKARADLMGLSYHPSIKVETLRKKIADALTEEPVVVAPVADKKETDNQRKNRKRLEASELVRIRVTNMNPNKKEYDGEVFTAGNSVVGTYKKYVPFNADDGWHVPRIIYNMLLQRKCQVFSSVRDRAGREHKKGKLIREFSIEVLPALTERERKDLAQRQAMAKGGE